MDLLLSHIRQKISLSDNDAEKVAGLLEQRRVRKKQLLLSEGEVCRYSYFVESGCLRSYTIDQQGSEHIISFAPSGWWAADMYSLTTGNPGQQFIECSSDSGLLLLSRANQEKLFSLVPGIERYFRILTENALVSHQQRLIDNLSLPALSRYENFLKKYPGIADSIPQKQIASYIGVTPEFLSKMLRQSAGR
jgi:CRP-like cAMP-binding protein